jgi:hypothetical protein
MIFQPKAAEFQMTIKLDPSTPHHWSLQGKLSLSQITLKYQLEQSSAVKMVLDSYNGSNAWLNPIDYLLTVS